MSREWSNPALVKYFPGLGLAVRCAGGRHGGCLGGCLAGYVGWVGARPHPGWRSALRTCVWSTKRGPCGEISNPSPKFALIRAALLDICQSALEPFVDIERHPARGARTNGVRLRCPHAWTPRATTCSPMSRAARSALARPPKEKGAQGCGVFLGLAPVLMTENAEFDIGTS